MNDYMESKCDVSAFADMEGIKILLSRTFQNSTENMLLITLMEMPEHLKTYFAPSIARISKES